MDEPRKKVPMFGPHSGTALDAFERAFGALRCGSLPAGTRVKVWDHCRGIYVTGVLQWYAGQPSILEDPDPYNVGTNCLMEDRP